MELGLQGRVAIVTGGNKGIGREISRAFAQEGCNVAIFSRHANQDFSREILQLGVDVLDLEVDISDEFLVREAVQKVVGRFTRIDALVNNAGMTDDGLFVKETLADWDRVLTVNLTGSRNCIQAVLPIMMKQRSGAIVNIGSVVGLTGNAGQVSYVASKAGLLGLTLGVAQEYGPKGICCNIICPGFIETDMTQNLKSEQKSAMIANTPLGRAGRSADIAPTVIFLASHKASFQTGTVVTIDGGLTMHL